MQISEGGLLKISAIGTVVGLVLLYFISANQKVDAIEIGRIDSSFVGKSVNITGIVAGLRETDSGAFFDLVNGDQKVKVILWESVLEEARLGGFQMGLLKNGAKINAVGLVDSYKGTLEVVPSRAQIRIV